jgi:hypothetical protein
MIGTFILSDALKYNKSICHVDLSSNDIGPEGGIMIINFGSFSFV